MLTYAAEVCVLIALVVVCLALPVTAIGLGIGALRSALKVSKVRRKAAPKRAAAFDPVG